MKLKKLLKIIIIFLILFLISTNVVFAEDYMDPNQFDGYNTSTTRFNIVDNFITEVLGTVLIILQVVTFGCAVVILIVIGIKYMTAGPNEKFNYKQMMPTYLIGIVLLFSSSAILRVISYFIEDVL